MTNTLDIQGKRSASDSDFAALLTPPALAFVAELQRAFGPTREALLKRREAVLARLRGGELPHFLPETASVRSGDWKVNPVPADLQDRRVEITGPVDRKMVINALNSGARVFMADFEDSHAPTWEGTLHGQRNMFDAVRRNIRFESPGAKRYELKDKIATLLVRPRGWHLEERHVLLDGKPISASLFDFGLFFFHNAKEQLARGTGPYFYLPKLESHLEARLWNDVFNFAESALGIPRGTIKATVLIETILAAFEMDEILYELREHSAGLNCGRWDYIFSFIKKFSHRPDFVLPDRAKVTMTQPFLKSYCELLVKTCHRRGAHAMGGMAAQIPIKDDEAANRAAMDKVSADKEREARLGHDGTWVAHPALVSVAQKIFDEHMSGKNQLGVLRSEINVTEADLLRVPTGEITDEGVKTNVRVGLRYLEAWLRGSGCVPLYNLMEDAATAEISRAQLWQWIRHGRLSVDRFRAVLAEDMASLRMTPAFETSRFELAAKLFDEVVTASEFPEFLTSIAYPYVLDLKK